MISWRAFGAFLLPEDAEMRASRVQATVAQPRENVLFMVWKHNKWDFGALSEHKRGRQNDQKTSYLHGHRDYLAHWDLAAVEQPVLVGGLAPVVELHPRQVLLGIDHLHSISTIKY